MEPFNGKCEMPQDKVKPGVVTVGVKRRQNGEALQPGNCSDQSGVAHTGNIYEYLPLSVSPTIVRS